MLIDFSISDLILFHNLLVADARDMEKNFPNLTHRIHDREVLAKKCKDLVDLEDSMHTV